MNVPTPRPIVVAIARDGSDSALRYAVAQARRTGSGLHLVHAMDLVPGGPGLDAAEHERVDEIGRATLRLAAAHGQALLGGQGLVTSALVHGSAVDAVVDASVDSCLVVMGRRPASVLRRVVTRSTSSAVAARAHVPVVSVPDGWTEYGDRRVSVGLDMPDHGGPVLRTALRAARDEGATLNIVHTWWVRSGYDDVNDQAAEDAFSQRAEDQIRSVLAHLHGDFDDVAVEIDVHHGRPADALIAASHRSDLVVVGRHDPVIPLGSHLGPVARAVLRDADCPVLLVAPSQAHRVAHRWQVERPVEAV